MPEAKMKKHVSNIQVGIDDTDHIVFYCPKCKETMTIQSVNTEKDPSDNCTMVYLECKKCNIEGKRKFYWKTDDGKFCHQKTF